MTTGPEVWVAPTPSPLGSVIRVHLLYVRPCLWPPVAVRAGRSRVRAPAGTGTGPVLDRGRVKHRAGAASYAPVRVSC